jgi:NAD-dependent SIR2 family protein deacetylase
MEKIDYYYYYYYYIIILMEEIDETIIYKILNQKYTNTPSFYTKIEDINLKNKNIIILCGSGITKDYGIETFEEMKQINYYDIFSLSNYENDTLKFYRNINLFKKKCANLLKINIDKIFVVTTNIDGMFIGDNLFEVHGNIFESKCLHCNDVNFNELIDELPLCKICNNIIRPNIQFYCDGDYKFNEKQYYAYKDFKNKINKVDTIIFEVGCGLSVPILRHESEVLKQKGFLVYRVNIKDFDNNTNNISMSGKQFIEHLITNI